MARLEIRGTDEIELQISKLADPKLAKEVVWAGAQPVADEIRKGLEKNLQGSRYSTGDLLNSLGIAPPDIDRNGNTNTKIGFSGYDSKGVPNAIKARVMESGSSKQQKRPFIRPAVNRSKDKAVQAMQDKIDEHVEAIRKEL
jgi:HK97 gp10 family phage protein